MTWSSTLMIFGRTRSVPVVEGSGIVVVTSASGGARPRGERRTAGRASDERRCLVVDEVPAEPDDPSGEPHVDVRPTSAVGGAVCGVSDGASELAYDRPAIECQPEERVDLTWTEDEEAFRAECRTWLEANVPATPLPSGDTARGLRPAPRVGEAALRRPLVGGVVARGVRRPRRQPLGVADLRGGVLPGRRARSGSPRTASSCSRPTIFEFGTQEQKDRFLPRMAAAEDLWCQGWSEPDAGSDLAGIKSRAVRDDERGGWRLTGQKTWTTRGAFCTHLFGLFRTDPDAERHRGMTYFLVPARHRGRHRPRRRSPRRRRGLRRGVPRGRVRARRPTCSAGSTRAGAWPWPRPRPSGASPCAARAASWPPPTAWSTSTGAHATAPSRRSGAARRRRRRRGWTPRPTSSTRSRDVTDIVEGRSPGRPVEPQQAVVVRARRAPARDRARLLGPHAELERRRPGAVDGGAWMKGYQFSLSGPDLRRHQRDPAQHRRRARARPPEEVGRPMRFAFTDDQLAVPRRRARPPRQGVPARGRPRRPGPTPTGPPSARLWAALAEMGVVGLTVPEADGGLGMDELDLVPLLEEAGRVALPEPIVETTAVVGARCSPSSRPTLDRADWLPAIASGEVGGRRSTCLARASPFVADADRADLLVAAARRPARRRPRRRAAPRRPSRRSTAPAACSPSRLGRRRCRAGRRRRRRRGPRPTGAFDRGAARHRGAAARARRADARP